MDICSIIARSYLRDPDLGTYYLFLKVAISAFNDGYVKDAAGDPEYFIRPYMLRVSTTVGGAQPQVYPPPTGLNLTQPDPDAGPGTVAAFVADVAIILVALKYAPVGYLLAGWELAMAFYGLLKSPDPNEMTYEWPYAVGWFTHDLPYYAIPNFIQGEVYILISGLSPDVPHSIPITFEVDYCYADYDPMWGLYPVYFMTESFTLNIDWTTTPDYVNLPPETPSTPSGPTSGYTYSTYTYTTSTTDPNDDSIWYEFSWGDSSYTTVGPYASGATASASHYWSSAGTYYISVRAKDSAGLWSGWSSSLAVSISSGGGGGGGGCPYVSTWNGSEYVLDNNLIPAAEYSNGSDVTDYYMLQQPLVRDDGKYSLLVWDSDKHSFLDQAQLMAVDHEPDVKVAVSPEGEILTYREPTPTKKAFNKAGENVSDLLEASDGQSYQGYAGDYILLDFEDADIQDGAKLVIRSDWPCYVPCLKSPVYIQTLNSTGAWQTVSTIYTRLYWSTDIIDLSEYLPDANGELKVRIVFTSNDKIDFIGLDTSKQGEFETRYATLVSAVHSNGTDMKEALTHSDNLYAELLPGEEVKLDFTLPQSKEDQRDFIIILEGHYYTI